MVHTPQSLTQTNVSESATGSWVGIIHNIGQLIVFVPTNKHIEPQTELKFVGACSFRSHSWVTPVFITLNQPSASSMHCAMYH